MIIAQRIQLKIIHPYKFIIIMISHQIFITKKNLHKPLHEFNSDEDNDGDNKPIKNKRESLRTNERSNPKPLLN
jgi:hypothetical protein